MGRLLALAAALIAATLIGIFVIPLLYLLVRTRIGKRKPTPASDLEGEPA